MIFGLSIYQAIVCLAIATFGFFALRGSLAWIPFLIAVGIGIRFVQLNMRRHKRQREWNQIYGGIEEKL